MRGSRSPRRSPRLVAAEQAEATPKQRATSPAARRRKEPPAPVDVESPKPEDKGKKQPEGFEGDYTAIALLLLLYTLQGVPMGLSASVPLIMVEKKVTTTEQALFSTVASPFAFKLLWAPIVDAVYSSWFGRRKTWIVPVQFLIGMLLLGASQYVNGLLGADGGAVDVKALTQLFFTLYFLCATQDIAVDGLALTVLSERNKEYGATCNALGQTLGYFLGYVGFLSLNALELASLGSYMLFWGLVFLGSTLWVLTVRQDEHKPVEGGVVVAAAAAYKEMALVLRLPAVRSLALVLLTCKAPLAAFDALAPLELQGAGVPKEKLAAITTLMIPIGMVTQTYVSRNFGTAAPADAPKPMGIFLTCLKGRLLNGALLMLLILGLNTPSIRGADGAIPLWLYGLGFATTAIGAVASSAQFVAQMAFYNRVSDPKIGGTYMTMLNTISNLGGQWPPTAVLFLKGQIEAAGVQDSFYGVTGVSLAVGALWLLLFSDVTLGLQTKPKESWRAVHDE